MYSRWFNAAVVILWLSTMTWLVTQKVLPPLLIGEPPDYQRILKARENRPPVGWRMEFDQRSLGWALSTTRQKPNGLTEICSRVHFNEFPLHDVIPGLLGSTLGLVKGPLNSPRMDAESTVTIDSLGRLSRFQSMLRIAPLEEPIRLQGSVEGARLKLVLRGGGDFAYTAKEDLPPDALLGGAFSPHTQLPGLRTGQSWTVPAYNPLTPSNPLEILQATVEGTEPIVWGGRTEETWLVVYRNDPGHGLSGKGSHRGRLWVRRDGTVLKQEVTLLGSTLTFVRLPYDKAAALAHMVEEQAKQG